MLLVTVAVMVCVLHNAELAAVAPSMLCLPVLQSGFAGESLMAGEPSLGSPACFMGRVASSVRVCVVQFVTIQRFSSLNCEVMLIWWKCAALKSTAGLLHREGLSRGSRRFGFPRGRAPEGLKVAGLSICGKNWVSVI